MDARSFPVEQALRMFEVDHRRTEVGRTVTKVLADVNPRLADIAIHGGHWLPGESIESVLAQVVRALKPLAWARPEMAVAAVMKPGIKHLLHVKAEPAWQGLLDAVQAAWDAHVPEVRS